MIVVAILRHGLRLLVPVAVACTVWLYLFPVFQGCAFPVESGSARDAFDAAKALHWPYSLLGSTPRVNATDDAPTRLAPFRLLALGDPQLEGDTSIPTNRHGTFPRWKKIVDHVTFKTHHQTLRDRVRGALHDAIDLYFEDLPYYLESLRKRLDHFGNDFYLAHIYRTIHWWANPTHVSVLGDLLGSQWINDAEFEKRGKRFWTRAFSGAERLPDDVAAYPGTERLVSGILDGSEKESVWAKRLLNVAGNHDVGYAGDLTVERMERFERLFGKANYEVRFQLPIAVDDGDADKYGFSREIPEIRIVALNDMNLDTPARSSILQDETYNFINAVISHSTPVDSKGLFTLILTHIPLFKAEGTCVDPPYFDFYDNDGGVREQNQLSRDASKGFLEGIFGMSANPGAANKGMGRQGVILNGHDHEGCDTYHFVNQTNGTSQSDRSWEVARWLDAKGGGLPGAEGLPGRREITVRSMMGGFGGNAGLLSLWFDREAWEWRFEYAVCPLGTQHMWWFVHIFDLVLVIVAAVYGVLEGVVAAGVDVDAWFGLGGGRRRAQQQQAQAKQAPANGSIKREN